MESELAALKEANAATLKEQEETMLTMLNGLLKQVESKRSGPNTPKRLSKSHRRAMRPRARRFITGRLLVSPRRRVARVCP